MEHLEMKHLNSEKEDYIMKIKLITGKNKGPDMQQIQIPCAGKIAIM
jgi:hypothetical protein